MGGLREGDAVSDAVQVGIQPVELLASFGSSCSTDSCGVSLLGDDAGAEVMTVSLDHAKGLVVVNATALGNADVRAGPLPAAMEGAAAWSVHAIVDRSIVELIVNNDTAFVVYVRPRSNTTQGKVTTFGQDCQLP